ncbi:hypothetical protein T484DRAFT_1904884, partial [Baffinella frigidus]
AERKEGSRGSLLGGSRRVPSLPECLLAVCLVLGNFGACPAERVSGDAARWRVRRGRPSRRRTAATGGSVAAARGSREAGRRSARDGAAAQYPVGGRVPVRAPHAPDAHAASLLLRPASSSPEPHATQPATAPQRRGTTRPTHRRAAQRARTSSCAGRRRWGRRGGC